VKLEGAVAAGNGESDLGFWEGEGWRGRGGWRLEREKVI